MAKLELRQDVIFAVLENQTIGGLDGLGGDGVGSRRAVSRTRDPPTFGCGTSHKVAFRG